ncbi:MAG: hypothetical protein IT552_11635 [Sphingomonadaceae bacterium]|nr:hypothetical protein [Sphingomonadaceae bacterium]
MIIPKIEGLALLDLPIMPLINASDAGARAAHVVQHGLGDFEADSKALKTCCERPAKIMQSASITSPASICWPT